MSDHRNQVPPDLWTAIGVTARQLSAATWRILLPWVSLAGISLAVLGGVPGGVALSGFVGWLAGLAVAWGFGLRLPVAGMRSLMFVGPLGGAAVGFRLAGATPPALGLGLVLGLLIHLLLDGAIASQFLLRSPLPWLVWPRTGPSRDDWLPRPVPPGLKQQVLALCRDVPESTELPDVRLLWQQVPEGDPGHVLVAVLRFLDPVETSRRFGRAHPTRVADAVLRVLLVMVLGGGPGLVAPFVQVRDLPLEPRRLRETRPRAADIPVPEASPAAGTKPAAETKSSDLSVPAAVSVKTVAARLAPDDRGDVLAHHVYRRVKEGVTSSFVWVPRFEAFQLLAPGNCGASNAAKPVGFWVANRPSQGVEDVDWARESFGGFYAGQFEASRADAVPGSPVDGSGATAGSRAQLKVAPDCVPWTGVTWNQAVAACQFYDPACHLMEDDEWAALAVWSMIQGLTVHGNTASGRDADDGTVTFRLDPTCPDGGRALTGTGMAPGWTGQVNRTTHTGTTAGVHDLTGNVTEWTATLDWRYRGVNGTSIGAALPITSLSTEAGLRRDGVPGGTGAGLPEFGLDTLWDNGNMGPTAALRGGFWDYGTRAGIWSLWVNYACSGGALTTGFRPVLSY